MELKKLLGSLDILDSLDILYPLELLEPFDPLDPLEPLDPLDLQELLDIPDCPDLNLNITFFRFQNIFQPTVHSHIYRFVILNLTKS